jgi:hypothetical protein
MLTDLLFSLKNSIIKVSNMAKAEYKGEKKNEIAPHCYCSFFGIPVLPDPASGMVGFPHLGCSNCPFPYVDLWQSAFELYLLGDEDEALERKKRNPTSVEPLYFL